LGKYDGTPSCALWFVPEPKTPAKSTTGTARGNSSAPHEPAKRQKTQGLDPAELDRKKTLSILEFDPAVAGTTRLPVLNVFYKKRGAKVAERLCMPFLTRGHVCSNTDCKKPHVTNIDTLPAAEKTKMIDNVKKSPGLTWVTGKAPTGTS
jgi:hypothetical protein